ncbi:MAG: hypothetical protein V1682_00115 [Candidatus Omnitrophota bacterium]
MVEQVILKVGDTIERSDSSRASVERIRIISKGEFIDQIKYDGKCDDIALTLKDDMGVFNLWLKDNPIRILEEKKEKKVRRAKRVNR